MIDHDALARRIEEAIRHNNAAPFIGIVQVTTRQCIANVLREALPTSETCEWTQQDTIFGVDWVTECGGEFRIDDGMPTENGMTHCCFCGKKLINVPFDEPEDEES